MKLPPTELPSKSVLQLWEFPADGSGSPMLSEEDCETYDLLQSAATYPGDAQDAQYGWLYMDCGSGANWASMGPDYWCPRASWLALYSLNLTQGYGPMNTRTCQQAFVGGEMALWSEIGGISTALGLDLQTFTFWIPFIVPFYHQKLFAGGSTPKVWATPSA